VQRLIAIFDTVAQTFDPEKSVELRLEMIRMGLEMWQESPIWGNGNEAFRVKSGLNAYSHSNYVELLANYGVIGFVLFYIPLLVALIMSLKGVLRVRYGELKNSYLWIICCVLAVLVSNFFMPTYYMKHMLMFLGIILGRLYYVREMEFEGRGVRTMESSYQQSV
jgi:O-antigen ligase